MDATRWRTLLKVIDYLSIADVEKKHMLHPTKCLVSMVVCESVIWGEDDLTLCDNIIPRYNFLSTNETMDSVCSCVGSADTISECENCEIYHPFDGLKTECLRICTDRNAIVGDLLSDNFVAWALAEFFKYQDLDKILGIAFITTPRILNWYIDSNHILPDALEEAFELQYGKDISSLLRKYNKDKALKGIGTHREVTKVIEDKYKIATKRYLREKEKQERINRLLPPILD